MVTELLLPTNQQVPEIMDGYLNPANYGYGSLFRRMVYVFIVGKHKIAVNGKPTTSNYDCLDAAILTQERLQKNGIPSTIWEGVDEQGIWEKHYFAVLSDGTPVDPTPPNKLIGANHIKTKELTLEEIGSEESRRTLTIGGIQHPLRYYDEGNGRAYLTKLGASQLLSPAEDLYLFKQNEPNVFIVDYDATELVDGVPTRAYAVRLYVDKTAVEKLRREGKLESSNNLFYLLETGIIKAWSYGVGLSPSGIGKSDKRKIRLEDVADMKAVAVRDLETVITFTMNLLHPMSEKNMAYFEFYNI